MLLRIGWGVAAAISVAFIWALANLEAHMSREAIQSFAHRKLQEQIRDADYLRYEPNVVMNTGYRNQHIVTGHATAIRIGRSSGNRIPTTEFQKIFYALIIAVNCSKRLGDCLEVKKIQVRSLSKKKPVI